MKTFSSVTIERDLSPQIAPKAYSAMRKQDKLLAEYAKVN